MEQKRIFMLHDGTAQSWHRVFLPARNCAVRLACEGIDLEIGPGLQAGFDAYVISRQPQSNVLGFVDAMWRDGKKIIWSIDDNLWEIPRWNPARQSFSLETCDFMLGRAAEVWVSTPALRDVVGRGVVLPNLIDTAFWPACERPENDPLRVVWAGSAYHEPDIELVAGVFEKLLSKYEDILCLFFGSYPTSTSEWVRVPGSNTATLVPHARYGGRLGYVPPVAIEQYPRTLQALNPDVCLAALEDSVFARSKSNLKWLEYGMAGGATVASALPPYAYTISLQNDLYEDCCLLIEDEETRLALGAGAQAVVEAYWTWAGWRKELWMEAFRKAVS